MNRLSRLAVLTVFALAFPLALRIEAAPQAPKSAAAPLFLDDEAEPLVNVSFKVQRAKSGSLSVVFDYHDAKNFYALDLAPTTATLRSVIGGVSHRLASTQAAIGNNSQLTLKRRPWLMQVILNHRVLLTAYDATFSDGKIGTQQSGGWKWSEPRVQPVEPLVFADDFTRVPGETGDWKSVSGDWKLTSSSAAINERNIELSTNPFSFRVEAGKTLAMTSAGRWFWDNYEASVSLRPVGRGMVGMAASVQDAKNYLAFEWSGQDGPDARRLVRVLDGKKTILARAPGAYLSNQWYRIGMRTSPGFVEAFVDGAPVFAVRSDDFGQGGIGLLAQNATANFDDANARSYESFRQDFNGPTGGAWTPIGGSWQAQNGALASSAAPKDKGARVLLAGKTDWDGYEISSLTKVAPAAAGGLVVGWRDAQNYALFRWAAAASSLPFKGRQQLVVARDGKMSVASDEPLSVSKKAVNGYVPLSARLDGGAVTIYAGMGANRTLVAQTADESLSSGRPGLWAQGAIASFRDVVMAFPPEPAAPKVAARMEDDTWMVGWASPSGEWPPVSVERQTPKGKARFLEFWNTGEFFGDTSVQLDWKRSIYTDGALEMALRATRNDFDSGYVVRVEGLPENKGLKVSVRRGDKTLKTALFDWKQLGQTSGSEVSAVPLKIQTEGRALLVEAGGHPALSFAGLETTGGARLSARATGFTLAARELRARSVNRDDYTFTDAPVDWYAPQGNWSVFSRWPCYGDWSFFGGSGLNPVLWSKRAYSGDVVAEIYAHNQMDLPKEIGYSHPGDLNISLCGDGVNPASGYSFIVAGRDNTRTMLYKGSKMVAQTDKDEALFHKTINHNMTWHRRWFYIRAEARRATEGGKKGVRIKLMMDDEPLLEYFDAQPLAAFNNGGRLCFWTVDGTMMIARAKIEGEQMGQRTIPTSLVKMPQVPLLKTIPIFGGFLGSNEFVPRAMAVNASLSALVSPNKNEWNIRNQEAGGIFAVRLDKVGGPDLMIRSTSLLSMDLMLPQGIKLDLYVSINGVRHMIGVNGDQGPDAGAPSLGRTGQTNLEGGWKHVEFDLGAALKKLNPEQTQWTPSEIVLGALHGDRYRWIGFDGNAFGATYKLRNARLSG